MAPLPGVLLTAAPPAGALPARSKTRAPRPDHRPGRPILDQQPLRDTLLLRLRFRGPVERRRPGRRAERPDSPHRRSPEPVRLGRQPVRPPDVLPVRSRPFLLGRHDGDQPAARRAVITLTGRGGKGRPWQRAYPQRGPARSEAMPAPDPAFVQQVTDWLRAKCPGHSCTACGAADWFAGEMTVPPTSAGG